MKSRKLVRDRSDVFKVYSGGIGIKDKKGEVAILNNIEDANEEDEDIFTYSESKGNLFPSNILLSKAYNTDDSKPRTLNSSVIPPNHDGLLP